MTQTPLPPFRTLAAALRETTERLAREITQPSDTTPQWNELQWRIAEAAAILQGITALLSQRLLWQGPPRWQAFIAEQTVQTRQRSQRILELLATLDAAAVEAQVPMVALKGSALYALGLYPDGDRPMGDIDLLARDQDAAALLNLLAALGYREYFRNARHIALIHRDARLANGYGEHRDNPIKIELHLRIFEQLPVQEVDITALTLPSQPRPGINAYPSMTALMRHLLLHAANNIRSHALRFMQLHDIALLARRMTPNDWQTLFDDAGDAGAWWMFPTLELTQRYCPDAIPSATLAHAASFCHRGLRQTSRRHSLTEVSWSNLRIGAFPGIEWSRSTSEILQFMCSRIFPPRAALEQLRQISPQHSCAAATPWYGLSHPRRILRWVFSHPPRVQAMYPVRMALGLAPR